MSASKTIPIIAKNLAHLAASDKCVLVAVSIDKENRDEFSSTVLVFAKIMKYVYVKKNQDTAVAGIEVN